MNIRIYLLVMLIFIQKNQKSKKLLKHKKHCDIIDKLININLRRNVGSIYTSRGKRCNNETGNSS